MCSLQPAARQASLSAAGGPAGSPAVPLSALPWLSSLQCSAVQCSAVLCSAVLCCAVLCCAVLCCAVLCCAVLCCAVLCCAVRRVRYLQVGRPVALCTLAPDEMSMSCYARTADVSGLNWTSLGRGGRVPISRDRFIYTTIPLT
ncbi:hypothetical protein F4802DRAFT_413043 [Xylaria palmicola]|nr:hypothetical protein F4802DRAFT_413043 [Xylaria palmicola]